MLFWMCFLRQYSSKDSNTFGTPVAKFNAFQRISIDLISFGCYQPRLEPRFEPRLEPRFEPRLEPRFTTNPNIRISKSNDFCTFGMTVARFNAFAMK